VRFSEQLLALLGSTPNIGTTSELLASGEANAVGLRHDVDHDPLVALRLARLEQRIGVRATYFFLPGAPYWSSVSMEPILLRFSRFGHEVALHNNVLAQWALGQIDCPYSELQRQLDHFQELGLRVSLVSSHGDRACYDYQFSNSWLFSDCWAENGLRPDWSGLSAEGVIDPRSKFTLADPTSRILTRPDGARVELGKYSLEEFGLDADASNLHGTIMLTDSGGTWKRSDFSSFRERNGPVSLLLHPEHWTTNDVDHAVVLSTARSGSKWAAKQTRSDGSRTTHEFILNNREKNSVPQHLTSTDIAVLKEPRGMRRSLQELAHEAKGSTEPHIDFNVYLLHFLDALQAEAPMYRKVALFRHPLLVAQSLIARNWFHSVLDVKHPAPIAPNWTVLSQFERVCVYLRHAYTTLIDATDDWLFLEDLTISPGDFVAEMASVGIRTTTPVGVSHSEKIDPSDASNQMTPVELSIYREQLGDIARKLGYGSTDSPRRPIAATSNPTHAPSAPCWPSIGPGLADMILGSGTQLVFLENAKGTVAKTPIGLLRDPEFFRRTFNLRHRVLKRLEQVLKLLRSPARLGVGTATNEVDNQADRGILRNSSPGRNCHIMLMGSRWQSCAGDTGLVADQAFEYAGRISVEYETDTSVALFLLEYDRDGSLSQHTRLIRLTGDSQVFAFRLSSQTDRFDLAAYGSKGTRYLSITEFELVRFDPASLPNACELLLVSKSVGASLEGLD